MSGRVFWRWITLIILISCVTAVPLHGQTLPKGYALSPHTGKNGMLDGYEIHLTDPGKQLKVSVFLETIEKTYPLGSFIRDEAGVVAHGVQDIERLYINAILFLQGKFCTPDDEPVVVAGFISPLSPLTCRQATVQVIPDENDYGSGIEKSDSYRLTCDGKGFWVRISDKQAFDSGCFQILQTNDGLVVIIPSSPPRK
jgi:hypothetical protein